MRVFISWSGPASHKAAEALNEWLPVIVQSIRPFLSSDSLRKGGRWNAELAEHLENTNYGIICVTPSNKVAPWLLFEAGALSKVVKESHVTPLLLGVKPSDLPPPLTQFNAANIEQDDFWKLVKSVNALRGSDAMEERLLRRSFDATWPNLSKELEASIESEEERPKSVIRSSDELSKIDSILQELLVLGRAQSQILGAPRKLFPIDDLIDALSARQTKYQLPSDHPVWDDIFSSIKIIRISLDAVDDRKQSELASGAIDRLRGAVSYIHRTYSGSPDYNRERKMLREHALRTSGIEMSPAYSTKPNAPNAFE